MRCRIEIEWSSPINAEKAAKYLGVAVWAWRERIWADDIPVVRFRGVKRMYIDVLDLEKLLERFKQTFK